eukprot:scaffold34577_cov62-Phaeocystis_antarctica.AAC.2
MPPYCMHIVVGGACARSPIMDELVCLSSRGLHDAPGNNNAWPSGLRRSCTGASPAAPVCRCWASY